MYIKLESDKMSVKAVLATHKINKHNQHPVWIRITKNRKPTYISTGYAVSKENWNDKENKLWETYPKITLKQKDSLIEDELKLLKNMYSKVVVHPECKVINAKIETEISKINLLKNKLDNASSETIKTVFNTKLDDDKQENFIAFAKHITNRLNEAGQIRTYKRYDYVVRNIEAFNKSAVLKFSSLSDEFLIKYENHLKKTGLQTTSIYNYFKTIRAIYYQAVKSKLISDEKNPFRIYQLKQGNSKIKEKLSVEEMKAIKQLKLEEGSLIWHSRNIFLFSFYMAGIRVGDCLQLKWRDITAEGRLNYEMDKTHNNHSLEIVPGAQKILNLYKIGNHPDSFIFPFMDNKLDKSDLTSYYNQLGSKTSQINNNLKLIGKQIGTTKKISFHISRHTFGNIARQKGVSIYDLQRLFRHSTSKITDIYVKSLDTEGQDKSHNSITKGI